MTANELSRLLFERWDGKDVPPNLDDLCSEMLEKQQARIEQLEKALGRALDLLGAPK